MLNPPCWLPPTKIDSASSAISNGKSARVCRFSWATTSTDANRPMRSSRTTCEPLKRFLRIAMPPNRRVGRSAQKQRPIRPNDISSYRKLSGQPRTHARPHTPAGQWRPTEPRLSLPFWPSTRRYASTSATRRASPQRSGPTSRSGVKRPEGHASWCSFSLPGPRAVISNSRR